MKNIYKIIAIILMLVLIVALVVWGHATLVEKSAVEEYSSLRQSVNSISQDIKKNETKLDENAKENIEETTEEKSRVNIPQKNLDWDKLHEINKDIYAWIYIPGTSVDYPILQSETDDTYYLEHNLDGSRGRPGCIYTESINSKLFTDYNTVIYGHNMKSGAMFKTLHNFEDSTFFDNNKYVYVYIEEEVLVYEIFASYTTGAEHILNTYPIDSSSAMQEYVNSVYEKAKKKGCVREDIDVSGDSAIITLSTCTASSSERYLVQAVLVDG